VAAFLSTVVLALLLGPEIALLSIAAIAAMEIGLASERGRGRVTPGWNAVVTVLLPWLAGHVAFAPLTIASAWSAASAALAFAALSGLAQSGGRAALIVAHLSLAGQLIATHHPLTAACVLVLLAPQLMLVPWLQSHQPAEYYLRYGRVWLLAVALITAWVL
jgi:hypothetical protein